jgi:GTP-binding protein EngB required for normal cell division
MPPKAKSKHKISALAKAVKTQRHVTPVANDLNSVAMDIRKAATVPEFSADALALEAGKRAPTTSGVKTVLASESQINVDRRIRNAAVPMGHAIDDDAAVAEVLTMDEFRVRSDDKKLMPRRPAWSFEVSSGRLHHREVEGFKQWLADVHTLIAERGGYPPAYEQNLQVWRQLWRTLERCHVVVVVVDARHPLLHLPPPLVFHVTRTLRKSFVVVLNKLDTVAPHDAAQWAACLKQWVPGVAGVVGWSKEPLNPSLFAPLEIGREALLDHCHRAGAELATDAHMAPDQEDLSEGRVMLGMVGHPNVGKSSLVNALMGGKVVSVKATPGHTKILQTLILDDKTCLCDSPGVIFPRLDVPREAQIVGMLIPIAQVREPFSAIRWVMDHAETPLPELLGLKPVHMPRVMELHALGCHALELGEEDDTGPMPWSPMLVCAEYAVRRGFVNGGAPNCQKAGMEILERVQDGRVPYSVKPQAEVPQAAAGGNDDASDVDSDWQIDDADYESEPEEQLPDDVGLLELFGVEQRGPGSGSQRSNKKKAKIEQKRKAAAEEESADAELRAAAERDAA